MDPRDDQAAARQRDLNRLFELSEPYMTGSKVPDDLFDRMSPDERAEADALIERLGFGTDPLDVWRKQKMLLHLAQLETQLRELLAKGDYRWRKGKIVRDPQTGQPLRNLTTDRRLRARLRELERLRTSITGLPPAGNGPEPT